MKTKQWHIYLVDLNTKVGTKPGKIRPCLCIRPDYFADKPSSVILPITTKLKENVKEYFPFRLRVLAGIGGLDAQSEILVDQIMAWDNSKFIAEIGELTVSYQRDVRYALKEFLDL
jgi:mRNA interferase MazF